MKKTSQNNTYSLVFNSATAAGKEPPDIESNLYTGCYETKWFGGGVNNINGSEGDTQVNFMHPSVPSASFY
ncbi:hypothetical protein PR048_005341 [Dryococelus australis]|uniref:Uncharacterized protein n=1 Tax=Dryococelus australis TaxID=614101 RepID=A0ABQ9I7Z0_9NEOP|nr:hypothetical protein PR048_005341 [Dryococelus australis]